MTKKIFEHVPVIDVENAIAQARRDRSLYLASLLKRGFGRIRDWFVGQDPVEAYMARSTSHADCSRRAKDVVRKEHTFL